MGVKSLIQDTVVSQLSSSVGEPPHRSQHRPTRGFLRKAADFESQPATLSYPGFLSDSAIPLCFRAGEHEAKSGSPRHTVPGDTGAWTRASMRPSARAVFGVAECQWSYSSIPGTPPIATVSRPSVMAPEAARSTRRAPRKVPSRKGMTWVEEDGVDEEETTHRGPDE